MHEEEKKVFRAIYELTMLGVNFFRVQVSPEQAKAWATLVRGWNCFTAARFNALIDKIATQLVPENKGIFLYVGMEYSPVLYVEVIGTYHTPEDMAKVAPKLTEWAKLAEADEYDEDKVSPVTNRFRIWWA
jgi:hypothetical protein